MDLSQSFLRNLFDHSRNSKATPLNGPVNHDVGIPFAPHGFDPDRRVGVRIERHDLGVRSIANVRGTPLASSGALFSSNEVRDRGICFTTSSTLAQTVGR